MAKLKKGIKLKESITFSIPPPPPAQVQTVDAQKASSSPSFSGFYRSNVKSFDNTNSFIKRAADYIKRNEGVRNKLYKDSKGKWTVGIGHLVTPQEYNRFAGRTLSDSEVLELFNKDIQSKLFLVRQHFGSKFDNYSDNLKIAILDGYFRGDLSGSPKARALLKAGDFDGAAREYLNNAEYRKAQATGSGVAARMQRNASIMSSEA